MDNKYYVYQHKHPVTEEILYIGKGSGGRAWRMGGRKPEHIGLAS